jgi:predicted ArsR family transcriptional regulator
MSAEATGWVWRFSPYKGHHAKFLIHLAVADVVNDAHGNEFWMSHTNLAEKVGVTRETVARWFADAVDLGLVECVTDNSRRGRPNCYRLVMARQGGVISDHTGCDLRSQGGVTSDHTELKEELKGTKASLASSIEQQKESGDAVDVQAAAQQVFDAWVEATGRDPRRARLNAKRVAAVKARMREGYTVSDLEAAARGIALSSWHTGDNPDGKKYDDLLLAIRDGERVEKFRDLFEQGGEKGRRSAVDTVLDLFAQRPAGARLAAAIEQPDPWGDAL